MNLKGFTVFALIHQHKKKRAFSSEKLTFDRRVESMILKGFYDASRWEFLESPESRSLTRHASSCANFQELQQASVHTAGTLLLLSIVYAAKCNGKLAAERTRANVDSTSVPRVHLHRKLLFHATVQSYAH